MEFRAFLEAIGGDTVSLLSGIGSVALLIFGLTAFYNKAVPRWIVLIVAALCFIFAAFRVWTTEHRLRLSAERELAQKFTPDFVLVFGQGSSHLSHGITYISLFGELLNRGADSMARNWSAHYKSSTLDDKCDVVLNLGTNRILLRGGHEEAVTTADNDLVALTSKNIPRGESRSGVLTLGVSGDHIKEVISGDATIIVTVHDYMGTPYTGGYKGSGKPEEFQPIPGLTYKKKQW
jgi:hypothetical protein